MGKLFSERLGCGRGRRFFAAGDLWECCGHRASQDFRKMNWKADSLLWQNNSHEFAFWKATGNKACVYRMLQLYLQSQLGFPSPWVPPPHTPTSNCSPLVQSKMAAKGNSSEVARLSCLPSVNEFPLFRGQTHWRSHSIYRGFSHLRPPGSQWNLRGGHENGCNFIAPVVWEHTFNICRAFSRVT